MQIVMPSVIRHSAQQPYKAMARFETGTLGGNLHAHGFSYGSDAPRMPRRVKAHSVEQGDESSDVGSENEDGCDRDEEVGGGGNEGCSDPAVQGECLDIDGDTLRAAVRMRDAWRAAALCKGPSTPGTSSVMGRMD